MNEETVYIFFLFCVKNIVYCHFCIFQFAFSELKYYRFTQKCTVPPVCALSRNREELKFENLSLFYFVLAFLSKWLTKHNSLAASVNTLAREH
jgi:hypothetical protein